MPALIRAIGAMSVVALTSACGFHPLYLPSAQTQAGLSEIYVDIVPNRNGQLFRQALQEKLEGSESDPQQHYVLTVRYAVAAQGIGIEADNASTRNRFIGTANWTLHKPGFGGQKITSGIASTVDGNDVIVAQFFYSDLNSETVNKRIGEALADKIVQELAIYFRAHPGLV
jgi:LPS-assembly lipoprotein